MQMKERGKQFLGNIMTINPATALAAGRRESRKGMAYSRECCGMRAGK